MAIDIKQSNVTQMTGAEEPLEIEDVLHGTIQTFIILGKNVHFLWYILGFIGNMVSIQIWTLPHMYEICSYAMYLTAIAVCDITCLFLHLFYYISFFWNVKSMQDTTLCETWTIIYMIPQYVSLFLVIGFIIKNLLAINDPFLSNRYLPRHSAAKQITGIVILVTTLSFPLAYLWKMENRGDCERNYQRYLSTTDSADHVSEEDQRDHDSQYILLYWLTDIGTYIPVITLVLSIWTVIKSHKYNKGQTLTKAARRNSQAAKTHSLFRQSSIILLTLSFFRVLTYLPNTVRLILRRLGHFDPSKLPTVYTIDGALDSEAWLSYTRYASIKICCDLIENSHLALGVFVYTLSSRHFRKEIMNGLRRMITMVRGLYMRWESVSDRLPCKLSDTV